MASALTAELVAHLDGENAAKASDGREPSRAGWCGLPCSGSGDGEDVKRRLWRWRCGGVSTAACWLGAEGGRRLLGAVQGT